MTLYLGCHLIVQTSDTLYDVAARASLIAADTEEEALAQLALLAIANGTDAFGDSNWKVKGLKVIVANEEVLRDAGYIKRPLSSDFMGFGEVFG